MNTTQNNVQPEAVGSKNVYTGSAEALISLGVLKPHELNHQPGRMPGTTVFLPSGEPCPVNFRAARHPGYKVVRLQEDGSYSVEITASREEQKRRRDAAREARKEEDERRLNAELAKLGPSIVPEKVAHSFGGYGGRAPSFESWEGTKAQLQAEGLGLGLSFPGEPGAPKTLHCTCPLGFAVEIDQHYDSVKAAAGLFRATSRYCPGPCWEWKVEQFDFAPGVMKEVRPIDRDSVRYVGAANALLAAGIVPSADLFPGQPGRNTQQCAYRTDLTPCTTANGQAWAFTIRRRGKHRFEVEVALPNEEATARQAEYERREQEHESLLKAAREEREQLRSAASQATADNGIEDFRRSAERTVDWGIRMIELAFNEDKGLFAFDADVLDDLSGAFALIRDAVQTAPVLGNTEVADRLKQQRRVVAAKTDTGLQAFLRQVQTRPIRS